MSIPRAYYPCSESVNTKNGFGVGHMDIDGLGLKLPCIPFNGHCGGISSTAKVSCESAFNRFKQL